MQHNQSKKSSAPPRGQDSIAVDTSTYYFSKIQPAAELSASSRRDLDLRQAEKEEALTELEQTKQEIEEPDYAALRNSLVDSGASDVDSVIAEMRAGYELRRQNNDYAEQQTAYELALARLTDAEHQHQAAKARWDEIVSEAYTDIGGNAHQGYYLNYCPDRSWGSNSWDRIITGTLHARDCQEKVVQYEQSTYRKLVNDDALNKLQEQITSTDRSRAKAIENCELVRNLTIGKPIHPGHSVWMGAGDILRRAIQLDNEPQLSTP